MNALPGRRSEALSRRQMVGPWLQFRLGHGADTAALGES